MLTFNVNGFNRAKKADALLRIKKELFNTKRTEKVCVVRTGKVRLPLWLTRHPRVTLV